MTIAYLLDDTLDKSDGVQQCVITIGEFMRSLGHDVHYLVADTKRSDLENIHSMTKFVSMKFNGNSVRTSLPASKKHITKTLKNIHPDVIHVQMPFSPLFSSRVIDSCSDRTKLIGTWHTFPTKGIHRLSHVPLSWVIRGKLKSFECTIGVSRPAAEFADSLYGTTSRVIPNAVDVERFSDVLAKEEHTVAYLGRFDERKGPIYLIKALGYLKQMGSLPSGIRLIMGGSGPDLSKCIRATDSLGLNGTIEFPGFIAEEVKPQFLASAKITVFPSTGGEAFGISVVEAMASGASIVLAGDNQGYRSILGEKPELLFDPRNTAEFARKLLHFMTITDKEAQIKKRWLQQSARKYDVAIVCSELLELYKN